MKKKGAVKTLAAEIKQYKLPAFLTPVCMIVEVIFEMLIPIFMGRIIDIGVKNGDLNFIIKMGIFMLLCALGGLISGLGGGVYGAKASTGFAKNLRKKMYDNIQTFSFSNIDKFSPSGLVTRLTTDVTNVQNAFQMLLRMAFRAPISMIVAMVCSFLISPAIASIYMVAVVVLAVVLIAIMLSAMKHFRAVFKKYDDLNESVQENVSAIRVVKAYVREEHEVSKFTRASENIYKMFVKAESKVVLNFPVMSLAIYTCMMLLCWVGAHLVTVGNFSFFGINFAENLQVGQLMTLFTYCTNILTSLMMLSMIFVMLTMSAASAERIAEVINEEADIVNPDSPIMEVKDGSIEFKNAAFAYASNSSKPVLSGINVSIKSGETVGIIGGTGSSKSSLVNLISRLYDVTEGSVLVGGQDVKDYDLEVLRDNVAVVLQKNVLFSGTIIENLRWGNKDASLEEVKKACDMACASDFIEKFPDGYDTYIEQGGTNVSGGQKQRLCIARALLKNPKVLILDDSTSAVDTATDAKIRKSFRELIPGVTKLIIAQRITSVQEADRIIVMDEGAIVGCGTHEELLKNCDIYRDVYESQTGESADFDEMGGEQ